MLFSSILLNNVTKWYKELYSSQRFFELPFCRIDRYDNYCFHIIKLSLLQNHELKVNFGIVGFVDIYLNVILRGVIMLTNTICDTPNNCWKKRLVSYNFV